MNWLDIVIVLIVLGSAFSSLRQGFSREVIGLAAVVLAVICGIGFYGLAGGFLEPYVASLQIAHFAGFAIVFLGILLLGALTGAIVSRFLKTVGLSGMDRLLGAAFGTIRGILISVVLVMALVAFAPGRPGGGAPESVISSRLAPYVIDASHVVVSLAPHEMKDGFQHHYDQVKHAWKDALGKTRTSNEL